MKKKILTILVLVLMLSTQVSNANFTFGTSTNLGPLVNPAGSPNISADGLELYFNTVRSGGYGQEDLCVARRQGRNDPWEEPVNLGSTVNSSYQEWFSSISQDGLSLYFSSTRPGGSGGWDLWMTTRGTKDENWGAPVNLGKTVNSSGDEHQPNILADGCTLLLDSTRPDGYGGLDIWITKRDTKDDAWGTLENLGPPINTSANDGRPSMSSDGLILFFRTDGPGGFGGGDIWFTKRETLTAEWGEPINLGPTVNTSSFECGPSISGDGKILYFHSNLGGIWGIWQVPIEPVVDLNGDGIVDAADMCIVVDNWGTDNQLCDIGPMPWGDGVVDVEDLIVLAEHLFEEIFPPELVAYWKLDETEDSIAHDSIGKNNGILNGNLLWRPNSGKVAGALEFDGSDDYIAADCVLNPADGPLSAFAWIKGSEPGQVIISQLDDNGTGETWLGLDNLEGKLMTRLMPPPLGRTKPEPLVSNSIITDDQWHHIGFVWDGSYRSLYLDGVEVAKDTKIFTLPLMSSNGGLYIGAGKNLEAGTFFSGLIDDVRIYNVALNAEEIAALAQ